MEKTMGKASPWVNGVHIANMKKLAAYLKRLPANYKHFNMASYLNCPNEGIIWEGGPVRALHEINVCGSAACALGHGPSAGIAPVQHDDTWTDYLEQHFLERGADTSEWDWCFSDDWRHIDNTPKGAGLRIEYMLKHSVPDNLYDQINGYVELAYLPKPKAKAKSKRA